MAMEGKTSYPGTRLREITEPGADQVSCSGLLVSGQELSYQVVKGKNKKVETVEADIQLKLDVDQPRPYYKALDLISGTIIRTDTTKLWPMWSGEASGAYFRSVKNGVKRSGTSRSGESIWDDPKQRRYLADLHMTLNDEHELLWHCDVALTLEGGEWDYDVELIVNNGIDYDSGSDSDSDSESEKIIKYWFKAQRTSKFFREVTIDIDYVDQLLWPIIHLRNYKGVPPEMKNRTMDLNSVFEDAGLKLHYNTDESQQVEDPTPDTVWTKGDIYAVMEDCFHGSTSSDANIWCLQATNTADTSYTGYSFSHKGRHGFGLFLKHSSFLGYKSGCAKSKAKAERRLLHYMARGCGHCLGLSHPHHFVPGEVKGEKTFSWMNNAKESITQSINHDRKIKPDDTPDPDFKPDISFYENFKYEFNEDELAILRHQPEKNFKFNINPETGKKFEVVFDPRSDVADDEDEEEMKADEEEEEDGRHPLAVKNRKVAFNIKVRPEPFSTGDVVEFEATLSNVGELPCIIEPHLQPGNGNLTVLVTDPQGRVKQAKPFVHGLDSPARKYVVLGSNSTREYATSYSETVQLGEGSSGPLFATSGTYFITATYHGAGLQLSSNRAGVRVEDDDSDHEDVKNEVRLAASLEGSGGSADALVAYWRKQMAKPIESKSKRISVLLKLMDTLSKPMLRVAPRADGAPAGKKRRVLESVPPALGGKWILADTDDLVAYLHSNGGKKWATNYSKLVSLRTQLFILEGNLNQAKSESCQLVADLMDWGVDYDVIKGISGDLKRKCAVGSSSKAIDVQSNRFQTRVEDLIKWYPKDNLDGKPDLSGLGLGRPFSDFDAEHKKKSHQFLQELRRVEEETDDLDAVLDHAEALQRSRNINENLYHYVIECFIVHSPLAKQNHVRYPDPEKRDGSMTSLLAKKGRKRIAGSLEGPQEEAWMNYWRCDADLNYHHKHWHMAFPHGPEHHFVDSYLHVDSNSVDKKNRQGELFGYMHSQMMARYNAERESWGLQVATRYDPYETEPYGFNAGREFHEDPRNIRMKFLPRPKMQQWPANLANDSVTFQKAILNRYKEEMHRDESDERPKMNANLAGFIIEATGSDFQKEYGSVHNMGHYSFTQTSGIPDGYTTYMNSHITAVRDPVFFRWHQLINELYQAWNDKTVTELGRENVGVVVGSSDVIITTNASAPVGFDEWDGTKWAKNDFSSDTIETYLREPEYKFERDFKIDHQGFSYHIRLARKPDVSGDLNLTIRIFICPKKHVDSRLRWIEMDKFVYQMKDGVSHGVIRRRDVESSVIKREKQVVEFSDEVESGAVRVKLGNCDCGWPYRMLLPRGTHAGEDFYLAVFVSNNDIDKIEYSASCGSMSFCGTRDLYYPDRRTMGFPYATPIEINGEKVKISHAAQTLDNFVYVPFRIKNDHEDATTKPPAPQPEQE